MDVPGGQLLMEGERDRGESRISRSSDKKIKGSEIQREMRSLTVTAIGGRSLVVSSRHPSLMKLMIFGHRLGAFE